MRSRRGDDEGSDDEGRRSGGGSVKGDLCPPAGGGGKGGGGNTTIEHVTPWDIADWASLGLSFNDFARDPSWANAGWVLFDLAGAVLPVVPALGTVKHGSKLIGSATDALKKKAIFVGTKAGKVVPVPKGYKAFKARSRKGIVFKPGNWKNLPHEDGNSIRIMDPGADVRYPKGYIRYYNKLGQPLNAVGKPGSQAATHHGLDKEVPKGFADFIKDRM